MATMSISKENSSLYVIISTALLSEGEKIPSTKRGLTAYPYIVTFPDAFQHRQNGITFDCFYQ